MALRVRSSSYIVNIYRLSNWGNVRASDCVEAKVESPEHLAALESHEVPSTRL